MTVAAPSLTDVIFDIVRGTAPRWRLRDVVKIGMRFRRVEDGLVVRVVQVHRTDRLVEVKAEAPRQPGDAWARARFAVSFAALRSDYELLVSLEKAR